MPILTAAESQWMRRALAEARGALGSDDVPVGAVVMDARGEVVGQGHNERERRLDPTAHAEMLAIRDASVRLGRWRLDGCALVVTLEPCAMCAGAIVQSRLDRLVFGAWDAKAGAVGSVWDVVRDPRALHRPEVVAGVLADECSQLLADFFDARRP